MKKQWLQAVLLLGLTGCYTVPATKVFVDPVAHTFTIQSPKDIEITNLMVSVQGTNTTVSIGYYGSKNNFQVIQAVADVNLATQKNVLDGMKKIINAAGGAVVP